MKKLIGFASLFFCLIISLPSFSQCSIKISGNSPIVCGESVQLTLESNWQKVNVFTLKDFRDVYFVNSQVGFICGDSGKILKTTNGGLSFQYQTTPTLKSINAIWFMTPDTGIAMGDNGIVLRTKDGGNNWVSDSSFVIFSYTKLFFVNSQIGFAACNNGLMYKTIDGGAHWTLIVNNIPIINDIYFTDILNGYLAAGSTVYKTIDGGATWLSIYTQGAFNFQSLTFLNKDTGFVCGMAGYGFIIKTENGGTTWTTSLGLPGFSATSIQHDNSNNLYTAGSGIYKSTNLGKDWTALNISNSLVLKDCFFPSPTQGIVVGLGGAIYTKTIMDSIVWNPSYGLSNSTIANPIASPAITTTYGVTARINGCVAYDNFTVEVNPLEVNSVSDILIGCGDTIQLKFTVNVNNKNSLHYKWIPSVYLNNDTLIEPTAIVKSDTKYKMIATASNGCNDSTSTQVSLNFDARVASQKNVVCGIPLQLNTFNGVWKQSALNHNITAVNGLQALQGDTFLIAANKRLYLSSDGGKTWGDNLSDTNYTINGICFRNSKLGYIASFSSVTLYGAIIKTTDGGKNWLVISPTGNYNIPAVTFTSDVTGYAIANPSKILKTTNGGLSWSAMATNTSSLLYTIQFVDDNTGYAIGEGGTILKTTNAGATWQTITSPTMNVLRTVYFTSIDTGFIAGYGDMIWKTTNGGNSWTSITINTTSGLYLSSYQITNVVGKGLFLAGTYTYYNQPMGTERGIILNSIDNGNKWNRMIDDSSFWLTTIQGNSYGNIISAGKSDNILKLAYTPNWYSWSPTTGLSNPTISNPTLVSNSTTQYQLKSGMGTCFVLDTILVKVNPMQIGLDDTLKIVCGDSANLKLNTLFIDIDASRDQSTWEILNASQQVVLKSVTNFRDIRSLYLPGGNYTFRCRPKLIPPPLLFRIIPFYGDSISEIIYWTSDTLVERTFQIPSTNGYSFNSLSPQDLISPTSISKKYRIQINGPSGCTNMDSVFIIPQAIKLVEGSDKSISCGETIQLDTIKSNYTGAANPIIHWTSGSSLNDTNSYYPMAFPNKTTQYISSLKTQNGCAAFDTIYVTILPFNVIAMDTSMHCNDSARLRVVDTYLGKNLLTFRWSSSYQLNDSTIRNPYAKVRTPKTYQISARSWNGCIAVDSFTLSISPPSQPSICIVGVSDANYNQLIWNKGQFVNDTFYIYKETNQTDVYQTIGRKNYDEIYIYNDSSSNPTKQSNKYKLAVKDACNMNSEWSAAHKTMHLTINKGLGTTWNLIWNSYEGFSVQTYNIYRGTDINTLSLIGTSSGSNNAYTDQDAPDGTLYYQVELISPNSCFPGKTYNSSRSNKVSTASAGINSISSSINNLTIYPNPSNDWLTIVYHSTKGQLLIQDINGKTILAQPIEGVTKLDVSNWQSGVYIVKVIFDNGIKYTKFIKE